MKHWNPDQGLIAWAERSDAIGAIAANGSDRPLRDYQETAINLVDETIGAGKLRPILQLPTGAGKTRIAAELIKRNLATTTSGRALFIVPRLSLIEQTAHSFMAEGLGAVGVMQGKHFRTNAAARVQIASAQTLVRRELPADVGLIIIDEAHLRIQKVLALMGAAAWADIPIIGLSATPWAKGLKEHFDALLKPVSMAELTARGFLVPQKIFCPPGPNLKGVKTTAGDYDERQLSAAMNQKELVADVIKTWLAKGDNRPTLLYGVDCAHAQHLQERFIEAGVGAAYIDGKTEQFDREEIFKRFRGGAVKVICSVGCLDTGIDLPMASCLIDARPTQSEMKHVQTIGRGLRTFLGKTDCVVLDHAGNTRRLGLAADIDYDTLHDGSAATTEARKKKTFDAEAIFCPECHFQLPHPKPRACPECGKQFLAVTLVRESNGELVEYGAMGGPKAPAGPSEKTKEIWYGALRRIAREKGYAAGWSKHQYREKFGHWPPLFPAPEVEPTVEIRNWVRSRQIAYAKARACG